MIMMKIVENILIISSLVLLENLIVLSQKLPDFIQPCKQDDSDINECFVNNSVIAIPGLLKGVDYLKIPVLEPLFLNRVELVNTEHLKLTFYNLSATGLHTAKVLDAKVDLEDKKISTDIYLKVITFDGTYNVDGRILILPIKGSGAAKVTFDGVVINFDSDYELENKNGTEYMHLVNSKLTYQVKYAKYQLKNLFNGDEFLSKHTNKFLNENWEALHEEFSPVISETIKRTVLKIINRIVDVIPFNEIFLPK